MVGPKQLLIPLSSPINPSWLCSDRPTVRIPRDQLSTTPLRGSYLPRCWPAMWDSAVDVVPRTLFAVPRCLAQRSGGFRCSLWEDSGLPRKEDGGSKSSVQMQMRFVDHLWPPTASTIPPFRSSFCCLHSDYYWFIWFKRHKGSRSPGGWAVWPLTTRPIQSAANGNRGYIREIMKKKRSSNWLEMMSLTKHHPFSCVSNNIRALARSSLPLRGGRGLAGKVIVIITTAPL